MVTLYDQSELLKVYDDVFTKTLRDNINQSDFGCVGCRGIMISYGQIWFDFSGKIIAIKIQIKIALGIDNVIAA